MLNLFLSGYHSHSDFRAIISPTQTTLRRPTKTVFKTGGLLSSLAITTMNINDNFDGFQSGMASVWRL